MDERKAYEQADLDYRVNKYSIKCLGIIQAVMAVMLVTNLLHIFIVCHYISYGISTYGTGGHTYLSCSTAQCPSAFAGDPVL